MTREQVYFSGFGEPETLKLISHFAGEQMDRAMKATSRFEKSQGEASAAGSAQCEFLLSGSHADMIIVATGASAAGSAPHNARKVPAGRVLARCAILGEPREIS